MKNLLSRLYHEMITLSVFLGFIYFDRYLFEKDVQVLSFFLINNKATIVPKLK